MSELNLYERFKAPPPEALKKIGSGPLKGKSDINPQWRIRCLTEAFGSCGTGWYTEIVQSWDVVVPETKEILCFCKVHLFYKTGEEWSKPVEGMGGSMLVNNFAKAGIKTSDEGYKMAETDAISVCCKKLGIGSDVYMGFLESKYNKTPPENNTSSQKDNASSDTDTFEEEVTILGVEDKKSEKGKQFFVVKVDVKGETHEATTFSSTLAEECVSQQGVTLKANFEKKGKYFNILNLSDVVSSKTLKETEESENEQQTVTAVQIMEQMLAVDRKRDLKDIALRNKKHYDLLSEVDKKRVDALYAECKEKALPF